MDKFEIRHSNLLAWLLDPAENHKLGNFFVKKFLAKVILKQENERLLENHDVDFLYIKNSSFGDLEVLREVSTDTGRKIDLLAVSESRRLVLLIENKYKYGEPEGQLDDYLNFAEKKYSPHIKQPSFILPEFRAFDEKLGLPRWRWWFNNAFTIWFERLKDNRLKLTIEVGPLDHEKRVILLDKLESKGVKIRPQSKLPDACYTKICTPTKQVLNWNDKKEILEAMNELYGSESCKELIKSIIDISREM